MVLRLGETLFGERLRYAVRELIGEPCRAIGAGGTNRGVQLVEPRLAIVALDADESPAGPPAEREPEDLAGRVVGFRRSDDLWARELMRVIWPSDW